jgi:hypothetical protein
MKSAVTCAILGVIWTVAAESQWQKVADVAVPRLADGSPNLSAPAPKARRGVADLTGVWLPDAEPLPPGIEAVEGDIHIPRYMINVAADLKPEEVPLQPWAAELYRQRLENYAAVDPIAHCKPTGLPLIATVPLPFKIVQTPQLIVLLHEENTVFRQVFLDGRKPVEDAVPRWMGYSTGRWEDGVLVVDTVGFNDRHWLDAMGHPNSDKLHLTERFRRTDVGHLEVDVTIDDPGAYTKPINYTIKSTLVADDDLLEYFCTENEKDIQHYQ